MIGGRSFRRLILLCSVLLIATGCAFSGLNSLPLPGAEGTGSGAHAYRIQFDDIGTLEPNSPVMIDDVVVGSVRNMKFANWHVDVEVSVRPDVVVPANAFARIGQTSLLGSMHVALDPPLGETPRGRLQPGATIPLDDSSTYPSTEQTLASLSAVVNGGGLGQIGDVIHNLSAALDGRGGDVRELLTRLDSLIGTLDRQRDNIIASIEALDRLAGTFAEQRDLISRALTKIPPALDVLIQQRPRITAALVKLGGLGDTATRLVNDTQADLVANLRNLEPALRALADVGPGLNGALAYATVYPYGQDLIDRGVRGDYMNLFTTLDLTIPRLKRGLLLGTRWGQQGATMVPAPGDPYYYRFGYDPVGGPIALPPPGEGASSAPGERAPILPVTPPPSVPGHEPTATTAGSSAPIFAGPYPPSTGGGG